MCSVPYKTGAGRAHLGFFCRSYFPATLEQLKGLSKSRSEPCFGSKRDRKETYPKPPFQVAFPLPSQGIDMRRETARDQVREKAGLVKWSVRPMPHLFISIFSIYPATPRPRRMTFGNGVYVEKSNQNTSITIIVVGSRIKKRLPRARINIDLVEKDWCD